MAVSLLMLADTVVSLGAHGDEVLATSFFGPPALHIYRRAMPMDGHGAVRTGGGRVGCATRYGTHAARSS